MPNSLPSGERLHFAMERSTIFHHAFHGKIHYFYGHFPWLFVGSPGRVPDRSVPTELRITAGGSSSALHRFATAVRMVAAFQGLSQSSSGYDVSNCVHV